MPFTCAAAAVALVGVATRPFPPVSLRPLIFLGKISYPLCLTHQYVGYVVMLALYARGAWAGVAIASACVVALTVATVLHFAVEVPCLELLRRRKREPREGLGALVTPA